VREERRPTEYKQTHIEVDLPHRRRYGSEVDIEFDRRRHYDTELDVAERQYRSKFQPGYAASEYRTTVDPPRPQSSTSTFREEVRVGGSTVDPPRFQQTVREEVRVGGSTVDPPRFQSTRQEYRSTEETVDPPRYSSKMGYYDEDGGRSEAPRRASVEASATPNTVTIPTHHIRLGDLLILQGRPCQVIKITTSSSTGQHRYLGVDLFTKQLHEESSFISNPSPSVIVQTMLGPIFKQYRVLDLQDGMVVAMTETGDVKQALPVVDQSNLWSRLTEAFESGRGSVRALVIADHGNELVVDMKVVHGSRL
jgi:translation elongation factor P/translation initiation factor 5A